MQNGVTKMLKVVLVDDEILALNLLEAILNEIGHIKIIGKYLNPMEGLEEIRELKPDVVFLDIEMPEITGMKLAEQINHLHSDIVFVTAYEHYALEAFNVQAVDYVLKPIEKTRLKKTVDRIIQRRSFESPLVKRRDGLQARYLGSFQLLDWNNEPIRWRTKKVKELCAYLIHHHKPVHKDSLMDELWPQHSLDKASVLLHTTVYQLRKKLRDIGIENPIQFTNERYSLTFDVQTDVEDLQKYVGSNNIESLVDFYHVPYLFEEDYPWSAQRREDIHKDYIQCLNSFLLSAHASLRKQDIYRKVLEKLRLYEPWKEHYVIGLVKYYVNCGEYDKGKETFMHYQNSIRKELGVEPKKEFQEKLQRLLQLETEKT